MNSHTLSAKESIIFGWENFKKRPWFFIGAMVVVLLLSAILSSIAPDRPRDFSGFLLMLAVLALNILIEIGLVAFALKAHDKLETVTVRDLWHPHNFWQYVVVKILTGIIVIIGLILVIVPGVIAALALIFATYLVVDRNMSPIEAMKESVKITKGHRLELFLLALGLMALNVLGALALLVGLVITVPVSLLAIAHAYRTLVPHSSSH
jgi:uncharacterized membrane protein